ncbi:42365_t:CDS:2 [Gigaspora margarita]|uniref:42365_t:CDS:1 n=1 Tax=Gigaspora margarita TaxID=4874 RepID=A0ABN7V5S9_GIGMA|nr:42365_t:CDS:2 [Gigaspora margarita]
MLAEESNDREYSTKEGVVKDPLYEEIVKHGDEAYEPPKEPEESSEPEITADPATKSPPELRPSTLATRDAKGLYEEQENEGDIPVTGGAVSDDTDIDASKQLSSLVAASHRQSSNVASKKQSAEKASELHEKITGDPLEISETGEVLTGTRISSG